MKQTDILLLLGLGIGLMVFMKKAGAMSIIPAVARANGVGTSNTGDTVQEIVSKGLNPGDAGYGWRNFTNGVSINPDGTQYYLNGQPLWGNSN